MIINSHFLSCQKITNYRPPNLRLLCIHYHYYYGSLILKYLSMPEINVYLSFYFSGVELQIAMKIF